jgi:hypothetical protein
MSVEDDILKYNWKLDTRFTAFAEHNTEHPDYNK